MPKNFLDIMRPEDRERMLERYNARMAQKGIKNKVSNEMYLLAEFGLMYGWSAVRDVRNDLITYEEMFALIEAGRKVQTKHHIDDGVMTGTAVSATLSKHPKQVFALGARKFEERNSR